MVKVKKIYIDCGAWTGDSVKVFKNLTDSFDIYAFDCEPRVKNILKKLSKRWHFTFIDKAVWIKDEKINLYMGKDSLTQSSSLYKEKKKFIDKENPIKVDAIDFSTWIINTFDFNDYIVCKMNIEGAEYIVLEKMLMDKSIDYINKLYVSWHWKKLEYFPKQRHLRIKEEVEKRTKVFQW